MSTKELKFENIIITQWWIPFIYRYINNLEKKNFIIINFSNFERILSYAALFSSKCNKKHLLIKGVNENENKNRNRNINLNNYIINSIEYQRNPKILNREITSKKLLNLKKQLNSYIKNKKTKNTKLLCWNATGIYEQFLINDLKIDALIFENGYLRPGLSFSDVFHRNYPSIYRNPFEKKNLKHHLLIKEYLFNIEKLFGKKIELKKWMIYVFCSLLFKLFKKSSKLRFFLNPKNFSIKDLIKNLHNKLKLILIQIKINKSYNKCFYKLRSEINQKACFFDQVPMDSSIILDESLKSEINYKFKNIIKKLLKMGYEVYYKPHPKGKSLERINYALEQNLNIVPHKIKNEFLMSRIECIATFNSTAGFEGLNYKNLKSLISLGDSFYKAYLSKDSEIIEMDEIEKKLLYEQIKKLTIRTIMNPLSINILRKDKIFIA